jgi:O-acetyl-ADP-ribose deacetylase (regulator of RNase III)
MIYEVEGDILLTRAQVIAQEVAVNDLMNNGLARKLAVMCPGMPEEFQKWCQGHYPEPGEIWFWSPRRSSKIKFGVVNLIAREGTTNKRSKPGSSSKINLLRNLRELNRLAKTGRWDSIAVPKLGSEFGGMDWYEVRGLIHSQLGDLLIPVYVYVGGRAGQIAFEPGK